MSSIASQVSGSRSDDKRANVLLVEDDAGDALLVREALDRGHDAGHRCHLVGDGDAALRFARQSGEFADAPRPRLILLDLNLPGLSGLEVLGSLKSDDELRTIPVVVLSSSRHPADVSRSYRLHANAYIVKPVDLDDFVSMIAAVDACFLRQAEPAPEPDEMPGTEHPVIDSPDSARPARPRIAPAEP
jgi:CheY-like chemotaxis protein